MYTEQQPLIAEHARTPQGFADVVTFVIATENQHFYRVGRILESIWTEGLDRCSSLNSTQKRGIAYAHLRAADYTHLVTCDDVQALKTLVEIPSIGIVKAGFIRQLTVGSVGCLDRHNLKTAGFAPRSFDRLPQRTEGITARLEAYVSTCTLLGGSETLYDTWCRLIAAKYPEQFKNAEDVSEKHALWCCAI